MEKTIKLHKFQDQAIFAKERFVALIAGIQSGKTIGGAIWARMMFDKYEGDDGLIAAPNYKILQQSTLPKFFEINPDLKRYYRKGDSIIEVPGRGKIYIRSTDNPNVIEGMTLRWIWPDEAGQMKLDAWINFQGRLSILQGSLLITTTPYALNWLKTDFYDKWKKGVKDYKVVQFRSVDSPYFPKEEFERVKNTMDARTFRRRYCGLLEKMEGLVYDDFMPSIHIIEPKKIEFKEVIAGIDWGFNHPTAIAIIGVDKDNCFYLIDEYYERGKITSEIIEKLKFYQDKYKVRFWYPDPAEPDRLEEMKQAGLFPREVNKGKGSVSLGIDKVRALIKENRFKVFNTCKYAIEEFNLYCYPDEDKGIKEEPIKENDDLMDAGRYAIMTYQPNVGANIFDDNNDNKPKFI